VQVQMSQFRRKRAGGTGGDVILCILCRRGEVSSPAASRSEGRKAPRSNCRSKSGRDCHKLVKSLVPRAPRTGRALPRPDSVHMKLKYLKSVRRRAEKELLAKGKRGRASRILLFFRKDPLNVIKSWRRAPTRAKACVGCRLGRKTADPGRPQGRLVTKHAMGKRCLCTKCRWQKTRLSGAAGL